MAFQRGDVVLIPFPYTDLAATKTRPAVVVSSDHYHAVRSELLLAYVSSQLSKAHDTIDYVLTDWAQAGLPKPSFVRPKIAAIEPSLIVHQAGRLSAQDMRQVDGRLRQALALDEMSLSDIVETVDFVSQPAATVQSLAEKSLQAAMHLTAEQANEIDLDRLRALLS
jgi:mRNA interferase MazF